MSKTFQYDVVIAGGGTAGVAAAVGAARAKAKTLLIERNPYLGGEATHSGVSAFCGYMWGQSSEGCCGSRRRAIKRNGISEF